MIHFPEEIFRIIQTYLSYDDYRYFLNTSKQFFASLKRKTVYFSLNVKSSFQYLTDIDFQRLLLSKVENGWDQITIRYQGLPNIPSDLPIREIYGVFCPLPIKDWNKFKSIVCTYPKDQIEIPPIPNVKSLHLVLSTFDNISRESMNNLNAFSHLSKLWINNLKVKDISPLKNISDLALYSCDMITDFSMFCNQRVLKLNNCPGLSDVTSFKSIRRLELINCCNVTDVTPLNNVYDLRLISCPAITDISCLGNHHRLIINQLASNLTGYECLLNIPHVSLVGCNLKDVSILRYAKSVSLSQCSEIKDVSPLRNVKKVEILMERILFGLHELQTVTDLSLHFQNLPEQEIPFDFIVHFHNKRLELISHFVRVNSLSMFSSKIEYLTIRWSENISRLINEGQGSSLQYLTYLALEYMSLDSLEGLGNIPTVKLSHCSRLRNLQGLGQNRCVEVMSCFDLKDVSSLATVPIVTIKRCDKLTEKSYECLRNVPRLKIEEIIFAY